MLALLAYSLLSWQDAAVKWLVVTVPVAQILFVRSTLLVAGCLAGGGRPLLSRIRTTAVLPLLLLRGAVTLAAWSCYFTAARSLPLSQLLTLYFTAPVIVTLLAAPLLGEHVGRVRWIAVGIGFLGTVLAAGPTRLSFSLPTALVLAGAVLWACGVILTRRIIRHEPSLVQMLFNNLFFMAATGVMSTLHWHGADATEWLLLGLVAVLGGLGQFCLFESARMAQVSVTAPLEYTALIWAFCFGYLIWGDVPGVGVKSGAGLIAAAGLLLVAHERRAKRIEGAAA